MTKKRVVQVGLGSRSQMFLQAVTENYKDEYELVALCDNNEGRLNQRLFWAKSEGVQVQGYGHEDFDIMITESLNSGARARRSASKPSDPFSLDVTSCLGDLAESLICASVEVGA